MAAYACEPANATEWYVNIESAEWRTARPLAVGSRFAFVARFLGRRLAYTYEVKELVEGERLVMATSEGPFPMETTYTWSDAAGGGTLMRLRNRGAPRRVKPDGSPRLRSVIRVPPPGASAHSYVVSIGNGPCAVLMTRRSPGTSSRIS